MGKTAVGACLWCCREIGFGHVNFDMSTIYLRENRKWELEICGSDFRRDLSGYINLTVSNIII